ncbi:hypothetical protein L6R50_10255 [Myxococcota bacterium]|nr:hypothetical protein [Myxococcota bacterium]
MSFPAILALPFGRFLDPPLPDAEMWIVVGDFRFGPREAFWLSLALFIIWLSTRGRRRGHLSRRGAGGPGGPDGQEKPPGTAPA